MKLWEKVKGFFFVHKDKKLLSEHEIDTVAEKLQAQSRSEEAEKINLKSPVDYSLLNEERVSLEGRLLDLPHKNKINVEEVSCLSGEQELRSEVVDVSIINKTDELVVGESNLPVEILNEMTENDAKKKNDLKKIKELSTPISNHDVKADFEKVKKDLKCHLITKGLEYEEIQERKNLDLTQVIRSNVEEVSGLTEKKEPDPEAINVDVANKIDELATKESNLQIEVLSGASGNCVKKMSDLKKPSTPMPNHNVKVDFEKYKEDFKYYLSKGSEYEQIRAIQSVKKAVREKESYYGEWLDILLDVYQSSNKKIKKYVLDTLKSFPLNMEESKRINELDLSEKTKGDLDEVDTKLDKPRVMVSRTVEDKMERLVQHKDNKVIKKPSPKEVRKNDINKSVKKEQTKKINRETVGLKTYPSKKINHIKITEKEWIKEECIKRNITSIYHFTNARNVKCILQYGILSLTELEKKNIIFEANDNDRRDGMKNSTCWSISFPNNKYFHIVRKRKPNMKWCVIEVDASLLFELECYFFESNAASNLMKAQPASSRKAYSSFIKMFVRRSSVEEIMPSKYTTDVQAEVLITENVDPNRIKAIHTQDDKVFDYYFKQYPNLVKNTPSLFKMRQ